MEQYSHDANVAKVMEVAQLSSTTVNGLALAHSHCPTMLKVAIDASSFL